MVQAIAAAWTFSGCRSNEIYRLELDCTYYEDVPEQTDPVTGEVLPAFRQAMLRVPANKTSGEFVKPIELRSPRRSSGGGRRGTAAAIRRPGHPTANRLFIL